MRFDKKGKIGILVVVIVITITGFVILFINKELLAKISDSVFNPLNDKLKQSDKEDLEKQKEEERISNELLRNAENVYAEFKELSINCIQKNPADKKCICGTLDITKLNEYHLKVSNTGGAQILELLDSRKVPVPDKRIDLGKFLFGPLIVGNIDFDEPMAVYEKSLNLNYVMFSYNSIVFNTQGFDRSKSLSSMEEVNFIKPIENVVIIDELNYGLKKCGT